MPNFPTLNTQAVVQYPTGLNVRFRTEVITFLDGKDQRCNAGAAGMRSWLIQLDKLSFSEQANLEKFFRSQQGRYSTFAFPDPLTGEVVANCRLSADSLMLSYNGINQGSATVWVQETNG